MHKTVKSFLQIIREDFPLIEPVYEFGSLQVPGQEGYADVRPIFSGLHFTGCDIQKGPGVDRILNIEWTLLKDESLGTILLLDTLEHIENPIKAINESFRILKPGGVFVITSVFNYPIHKHPTDFWRFTPDCFSLLLKDFTSKFVGYTGPEILPTHIFGVGFKFTVDDDKLSSLSGKLKSILIKKGGE